MDANNQKIGLDVIYRITLTCLDGLMIEEILALLITGLLMLRAFSTNSPLGFLRICSSRRRLALVRVREYPAGLPVKTKF